MNTAAIPPNTWQRLSETLAAETGLWFPQSRHQDLHNGVAAIAAARGTGPADCLRWLLDERWGQAQLDACARHLTVGETYFFREPRAFDLIRAYALEKLSGPHPSETLRIWSAGCSTGEEAYSIAMALFEVLDTAAWERVKIVGTDINPSVLAKARKGLYRGWSFRGAREAFQTKYFTNTAPGHYQIDERIRTAVDFEQANLTDRRWPAASADLILCRNVLMYLSEAQTGAVIARFHRALVHGGWLITSCTEASHQRFSDFQAHLYDDAVHYQKLVTKPDPRSDAGWMPRPLVCGVRPLAPRPAESIKTGVHSAPRRRPAADPARPKPASSGPLGAHDLAAADSAISASPLEAEPYYAKAQALMEIDQAEAAEAQLRRALYLAPRLPMAHYLLGLLMLRRRLARQGELHLRTALSELTRLAPDEIVPHSDGFTAAQVLTSVQSLLERDNP